MQRWRIATIQRLRTLSVNVFNFIFLLFFSQALSVTQMLSSAEMSFVRQFLEFHCTCIMLQCILFHIDHIQLLEGKNKCYCGEVTKEANTVVILENLSS